VLASVYDGFTGKEVPDAADWQLAAYAATGRLLEMIRKPAAAPSEPEAAALTVAEPAAGLALTTEPVGELRGPKPDNGTLIEDPALVDSAELRRLVAGTKMFSLAVIPKRAKCSINHLCAEVDARALPNHRRRTLAKLVAAMRKVARADVAAAETVAEIEQTHDALPASVAAPAAPAAARDAVLIDIEDMPRRRHERGLSQQALADMVATSRGSLALIEKRDGLDSRVIHVTPFAGAVFGRPFFVVDDLLTPTGWVCLQLDGAANVSAGG
jgi:hypothetical protein